jgi:hypothetical protein
MAGSRLLSTESEKKAIESALVNELGLRAVRQGVVDNPSEVVVRDMLPLTDFGSGTTNATSASAGYRSEDWSVNLTTYQQNGSTASAAGSYNTVINCNMNKEKVVGFIGVQQEDQRNVVAIRWSLGSGAKIKDIWQVGHVPENGVMYAENPIVYNSTNVAKVEYYINSTTAVRMILLGKTAEAKGDTILGAE